MTLRRIPLLASAIAIGLVAAQPTAGQSRERERLLEEFPLGERATLQEERELETGLGSDFRRGGGDPWNVVLRLEYGFSDRFQIELDLPFRSIRTSGGSRTSGAGDVEIGALYGVIDELDPVALSAGLHLSLPSGSEGRGLGEGEVVVEPVALAAMKIGPGQVQLGVGVGISREVRTEWTLAVVYPRGFWRGILELNGGNREGQHLLVSPGVAWHGPNRWEMSVGIPIGLTASSPSWGVIAKLTREIQF